jgi:hypothetical protein
MRSGSLVAPRCGPAVPSSHEGYIPPAVMAGNHRCPCRRLRHWSWDRRRSDSWDNECPGVVCTGCRKERAANRRPKPAARRTGAATCRGERATSAAAGPARAAAGRDRAAAGGRTRAAGTDQDDAITASEYGWGAVLGSTVVVLVVATFGVPVSAGWNWARPVPEGDRARC